MSEWSEWLVYRLDGAPIGPLSTKAVAEAILAGTLAQDVWVAAPTGSKWLRAMDVPVVAELLQGLPTRRSRESGLRRVVTAPLPKMPLPPKMDDTIRMRDGVPVDDDEKNDENDVIVSSDSPPTIRSPLMGAPPPYPEERASAAPLRSASSTGPRGPDGFPIPAPPPSSTPTPPSGYRAGETLDSPGTPRKRSQGG